MPTLLYSLISTHHYSRTNQGTSNKMIPVKFGMKIHDSSWIWHVFHCSLLSHTSYIFKTRIKLRATLCGDLWWRPLMETSRVAVTFNKFFLCYTTPQRVLVQFTWDLHHFLEKSISKNGFILEFWKLTSFLFRSSGSKEHLRELQRYFETEKIVSHHPKHLERWSFDHFEAWSVLQKMSVKIIILLKKCALQELLNGRRWMRPFHLR